MNHHRLAMQIAGALGLGPLLTASAACGGKVVFDDGEGGGSSFSTTSNGNTTSSSTGSGTCTKPVPQGETKQHVCIATSMPCPPNSDPGLPERLADELNAGLGCADRKRVMEVACGPSVSGGQCCYDVFTLPQGCTGRPLTIHGLPQTAAVAVRADWIGEATSPPALDEMGGLDAETRTALAEAWSRDALCEHASIASFARFALELLALGAPADLVAEAQRAMGDEIRHAELSFALASRYLGSPCGPSRLRLDGLAPAQTLEELAEATVREGCVSETVSALLAAEARDAATDPEVRAALVIIAADEARHAELAWRTVGWALSRGSSAVRTSVVRAFADSRVAPPSAEIGSDPLALRARGQLSPVAKEEAIRRGLREIVAPLAEALLSRFPIGPDVEETFDTHASSASQPAGT